MPTRKKTTQTRAAAKAARDKKKARRLTQVSTFSAGTQWCMHCFRTANGLDLLALKASSKLDRKPVERVPIVCGFSDATSARCEQCAERGDTCVP